MEIPIDTDGSFPLYDQASAASVIGRRVDLDPRTAPDNTRMLVLMSIRDAVEHPPLAQEIFDELAIAIIEGRLRPGDSLNSVDLAKRFGTSRAPVREALAALDRQGVISVPPRRRPFVTQPTLKQVKDLYDVRACLFALIAKLIVDTCPKHRLSELWAWQAALDEDVKNGSVDRYFWHNVGFRLVETRLAGNMELQRSVAALGLRTQQFRHLSLSQPGRLQRSVEDHRRLLVAYEEGDKATAVGMTRALIMSGYRAIERSGLVALAQRPGSGWASDEPHDPGDFGETTDTTSSNESDASETPTAARKEGP